MLCSPCLDPACLAARRHGRRRQHAAPATSVGCCCRAAQKLPRNATTPALAWWWRCRCPSQVPAHGPTPRALAHDQPPHAVATPAAGDRWPTTSPRPGSTPQSWQQAVALCKSECVTVCVSSLTRGQAMYLCIDLHNPDTLEGGGGTLSRAAVHPGTQQREQQSKRRQRRAHTGTPLGPAGREQRIALLVGEQLAWSKGPCALWTPLVMIR